MVYIRLFHGRINLCQDMNDWGSDGPIFGPYEFAHTTYQSSLRLGRSDGNCVELHICGPDLIYYNGVYYGDWSIFCFETLSASGDQTSVFDQSKANLPAS